MSTSTSDPFIFDAAAASSRGPMGRSAPSGPQSDSLFQQTKREITQLLRELASAARDKIPVEKFNSILCDRTLRAMSAEGVVIWESIPDHTSATPTFRPLARLGRVTDRSIDPDNSADSSAAWLAHQALLAAIVSDGQPAVVPATPDVSEPNVPANPTAVPAALVPIDSMPAPSTDRTSIHRVIEVFLEPDGGIATQRGYLRFVCQVADLAGEYYRAEQLRTLLWQQSLAEQCDKAIGKFQQLQRSEVLAAGIVDEVAEIFDLDRVAITRVGSKSRARIVAVSHVETIDHHSQSADQIRAVSGVSIESGGATWMKADEIAAEIETDPQSHVVLDPLFVVSGLSESTDQHDHGYRLTGFRRADRQANGLRDFEKRELVRTAGYALRQMQQIDRMHQSLWARVWGHHQTGTPTVFSRLKRLIVMAVIVAVITLVLIMPVPNTIEATATLRAQNTQRICALGDAVVETIFVEHGQHVRSGQILMTLSDANLEQQMTTLVGRRAVLAEQKFRLTEAMVDSSASDFESYEKIQGQQSVVDEEIASVNQQIALLEKMERSLTIRSDRDGFVDAWQINRRLSGRPVRRGDPLMQVISHDSPWLVDAQVSQSRIGRVRRADQASELSVMVTFDDDPAATHTASQWQFGPTRPSATASVGDQVKSAVTLTLDTPPEIDSSTNADSASTRSGAPARVYFHCGSVPLADLLVGDLYRDLRGQLALHWRLSDMKESEAF